MSSVNLNPGSLSSFLGDDDPETTQFAQLSGLPDVARAAGAIAGLTSGKPIPEAEGLLQTIDTAEQLGLVPDVGADVGQFLDSESLLSFTNAASSADGATELFSTFGEGGGPLDAAAALYTFGSDFKSGNYGENASNGASVGASIGTAVLPGIGTAVGSVIGAAVGALSSVFGGGQSTPENISLTQTVDSLNQSIDKSIGLDNAPGGNYIPIAQQNKQLNAQADQLLLTAGEEMSGQEAVTMLAGLANANAPDLGKYQGVGQEGNLLTDMGNFIQQCVSNGIIAPGESSSKVFTQVVYPWLQAQGINTSPSTEVDVHGNNQGEILEGILFNITNGYLTGSFGPTTTNYYGDQLGNSIPVINWYSSPYL